MKNDIYNQLTAIGISEELAHQVDKALSPEHVATKQDLLVMQEAMLQSQLKTDTRYIELTSKVDRIHTDLNGKIDRVDSTLRVEIAAISRQFWITFGGLITTILSVFTVNWYFH